MVCTWDEMHARERLAALMARSPVRQRLVALLLSGESRKEIARILQRSPHTIDAHLKAIYRHVGIGDRGRLMLLASRLPEAKNPPPPPGFGDCPAK
jgi:DNA-binding CsgD family transcriptional regulator